MNALERSSPTALVACSWASAMLIRPQCPPQGLQDEYISFYNRLEWFSATLSVLSRCFPFSSSTSFIRPFSISYFYFLGTSYLFSVESYANCAFSRAIGFVGALLGLLAPKTSKVPKVLSPSSTISSFLLSFLSYRTYLGRIRIAVSLSHRRSPP